MTAETDLIGAELDAAVARIEGDKFRIERVLLGCIKQGRYQEGRPVTLDDLDSEYSIVNEDRCLRIYKSFDGTERGGFWLGYSTHWELAGPIMDKNPWCLPQINTNQGAIHLGRFVAFTPGWLPHYGPTPLIAAMRAYVASKGTP